MPFDDCPLPLAANARAVADARGWVVRAFETIERPDLIEAAELGTSELVTNALLHAEPPFTIQLRGTVEHPRVEVADGSPKPPVPAEAEPPQPFGLVADDDEVDLDALLNTFGRGLAMVAMASVAWGASLDSESKVVWFEPSAVIGEDAGPEPILIEITPPRVEVPGLADPGGRSATHRPVHLYGMDPVLFAAQQHQYANLRRELRLLALAHEEEYPLARDLGAVFTGFELHFPMFERLEHRGSGDLVDLVLELAPEAAQACATMVPMLELADAFCQAQRLLSLARTPQVYEFQNWLLGEVIGQLGGADPRPWRSGPAATQAG